MNCCKRKYDSLSSEEGLDPLVALVPRIEREEESHYDNCDGVARNIILMHGEQENKLATGCSCLIRTLLKKEITEIEVMGKQNHRDLYKDYHLIKIRECILPTVYVGSNFIFMIPDDQLHIFHTPPEAELL